MVFGSYCSALVCVCGLKDDSRAVLERWRGKLEAKGISLVICGHSSKQPRGGWFLVSLETLTWCYITWWSLKQCGHSAYHTDTLKHWHSPQSVFSQSDTQRTRQSVRAVASTCASRMRWVNMWNHADVLYDIRKGKNIVNMNTIESGGKIATDDLIFYLPPYVETDFKVTFNLVVVGLGDWSIISISSSF